jgi:hypothetical protein
LQNGIAELQSSVDELSQQMQALEQQLSNKIDASDYRTTLTPALALAAQVDGVESDLAYFAQQCPALTDTSAPRDENTQRFCSNQKATVLGELNDLTIIHSYETLTTYVLDNPALLFNGMIHQFSLLIGENVRFFRPADSTKVQNTFDYWDYVLTQAANLKVELLHENGAQDVPGGVTQLTDFLGDASATPPKQGQFQNTHAAELKLMFPPVPVGTVVDTKYRNMWATGIPKLTVVELTDGSTISGCPAGFGGGPSDGWSGGPSFGTTWNGITGWASPTVTALQSLFDGWKGNAATPMSWLVTQTQAVAPDSPVSDGFFNILQCDSYYGYFVWTSTNQGSSNPNFYSPYAVVDLSNGQIPAKNTYPYGELNWLFLTRSFAQGEQYYWYP